MVRKSVITPIYPGLNVGERTHLLTILPGGFKYLLFSSLPGEVIQFDEHIFRMGWFNHQLALILNPWNIQVGC